MPVTTRKNTPRLRDGVMKRGTTWSYVIRVKDPETGISKPRWVGGFATEQDAKAARDEARVNARKGQYIDRNSITVAAYLDQWHDIDLDLGDVRITGSAAVIAGQRIEGTTKSGRSRIVSIDPDTVQVLRDHRKRQAGERLRIGPEWRGTDDYVFSTAWGEPIHPDTVSSLMTTLVNTHNDQQSEPLPHARLHDLRHVHATTLLLAGVPVHVVAARLGHADPSITLRVYAHVISDQLTEAADIFARAVAATS
jgi:site-specific recombinase XerC